MKPKTLAAFASILLVGNANAAIIAATNFNSTTKSSASETMTGIVWTGDDLVNVVPSTSASYSLLDSDVGFNPVGFFTTGYSATAFAPDLNIQNEGDWAATFTFDVGSGYTGTLTTISFNFQGLTNTGANQTGGQAVPFFITVNGNAFDITKSTPTTPSGSLSFSDTESLITGTNTVVISTDFYTNSGGWNIGIDDLQFEGAITAIPEPSSALLIGLAGLGFLGFRRR